MEFKKNYRKFSGYAYTIFSAMNIIYEIIKAEKELERYCICHIFSIKHGTQPCNKMLKLCCELLFSSMDDDLVLK